MKHLTTYKIFESNEDDITEEVILDNFAYLIDKLGKPAIHSEKFANSKKWRIIWSLGLDPSHMQEATNLIDKLKTISEELEDVISASERFTDYHFNMSITDHLVIEILPKNFGSDEFEFILKYDSRTLKLKCVEIERFFTSRGLIVSKFDLESSYSEYSENNNLDITLNKRDVATVREFVDLFNSELEAKQDSIEREYKCTGDGKHITIWSYEEKSYIDLV